MAPGVDVPGLKHPDRHLDLPEEHLPVAPGQVAKLVLEPFLVALLQPAILQNQPAFLERALDPGSNLLDQDRFGQVVGRAELKRLDRRLHVRHPGDHQHGGIGTPGLDLPDQGQPVHPRHVQIGDHQRDGPIRHQNDQGVLARLGLDRLHPLRPQHPTQGATDQRIIIDHETPGQARSHLSQRQRIRKVAHEKEAKP